MRLSARVILNYANINNFDFGNQWTIRAGDPNSLYFQIVDLDKLDGKSPLRYLTGVETSNRPVIVTVTFPSIDDDTQIVATAEQVDDVDGSVWKVDLTASQIPGSGSVQFAVSENSVVRRFGVLSMMSVEYPDNDGSC